MKFYIQVSLCLIATVFLVWTGALLVMPYSAHAMLSHGPYDHTVLSLFGTCLFAVAVILLLTATHPEIRMIYASEMCLVLVALMWGYQMLVGQSMPMNAVTVGSFIINVAVLAYRLLLLSGNMIDMRAAMSHRLSGGRKTR